MTENTKKRPKVEGERSSSTSSTENIVPSSQFAHDTSWFSQFVTTGTPAPSMLMSQTTSSQYNTKAHSTNQSSKNKTPSASQSRMARTSTSASPKPKIRTSVTGQTFETSQAFQGEAVNATNFFGPPVPSSNLVHHASNQLSQSSSQFFEDRARYSQIVGPERIPLGQVFPPGHGSSSQTNQDHFGQTFQLDQSSTNPIFPEQASSSQLYNDQHRGSSQRTEDLVWRSSQRAKVDGHGSQRLKKESRGSQRDKGSQPMMIKQQVGDNTQRLSQISLDGNWSNSQLSQGESWRSISQFTKSESSYSSAYFYASPWSDNRSAVNSFTIAPSSLTSPSLQSLMNEQSGSTQQTEDNSQIFRQISVNQSQSASRISEAQDWISRVSEVEAWRSGASQHTQSSDDIAPSSHASTIYTSSDSDTDLNDTRSLDPDSELNSDEDDSDDDWGDPDRDDSCDSDTTVRLQQPVLPYDDRASQSQSEYSYSQGSQLSQETVDLEDGYPSRLHVFLEGRHSTEEDINKDAPSQELDYGIGSWMRHPTVAEWMHEPDKDDDEEPFYEPLKRIRHQ
ncbi:hypothetical protein BG006_010929 [Podila minutissima]|uniref:Uncharacterized protein n=1 Tax=Podila minutissima TaxID=64525 RepID=A0A9P5SQ59_9FUNG|nr:hypothetical protein BG006_010929 [Podila minutissima]